MTEKISVCWDCGFRGTNQECVSHGHVTNHSVFLPARQSESFDTVDLVRGGKTVGTFESWPADTERPHYPKAKP